MGAHAGARSLAKVMALCLVAATGCSWALVQKRPPPPLEAAPPASCTSSLVSPIADTAAASILGLYGMAFVVWGIGDATCGPGEFLCSHGKAPAIIALGTLMLGAGVALGFSAMHGYSATSDCRLLKETQLACLSGLEGSCSALRGPAPREPDRRPAEECAGAAECEEASLK